MSVSDCSRITTGRICYRTFNIFCDRYHTGTPLERMREARGGHSFPISFLSRFQAKPNPAAEQCRRVFLKWLSGNLHFVQRMPAPQCPHAGEPKEIVSFCDASWGLDSVSGAVLIYGGCCVKLFSRKQEVPALSSAEVEIIAIVETAKEMVSLGMLLQTMIQGIPLDPLGMPLQTTGEMSLTIFNDAKAAIRTGRMDGLLRRVRHLELRVKYCQHLYRRRQLSLTHWRGEDNPADGLIKSLGADSQGELHGLLCPILQHYQWQNDGVQETHVML